MLKRSFVALLGRMNGVNPFDPHRPHGMKNPLFPAVSMEKSRYRTRSVQEKRERDPAGSVNISHLTAKRCRWCGRVMFVHISQRSMFHTCCEGTPMPEYHAMGRIKRRHDDITKLMRKWDFVNMTPKSNMHKPGWKGRSTFKKSPRKKNVSIPQPRG